MSFSKAPIGQRPLGDEDAFQSAAESHQPLYVQVQRQIFSRLVKGFWRPGDMLPSEHHLAQEYGVSQGTVRKALDALARDNLVIRRQGKGTFVVTHTSHRAIFHFFHLIGEDGQRHLPLSRLIRRKRRRASTEECRRLNLSRGARIIEMERVREIEGRPVVVETMRFPISAFPTLDKKPLGEVPDALYQHIEEEYGIIIHKVVESLKAIAASPDDARILQVELNTPLLLIDRIALTLDGSPIEWRTSRCLTNRYEYLAT